MDIQKPLNAQVLETNWQLFTESRLVTAIGIILVSLQVVLFILSTLTFTNAQINLTLVTGTEILSQIATFLALLYLQVATQTWASQNVKGPYFWIVLFVLLSIVFLVSTAAMRSRAGGSATVSSPNFTGPGIPSLATERPNPPASSSYGPWTSFVNLSFGLSIAQLAVLLVVIALYMRPILLALENVPRTLGMS